MKPAVDIEIPGAMLQLKPFSVRIWNLRFSMVTWGNEMFTDVTQQVTQAQTCTKIKSSGLIQRSSTGGPRPTGGPESSPMWAARSAIKNKK